MKQFSILLLLAFLLLGTVVADWFLHGPTTAPHGPWLLLAGLTATALFFLGLRHARHHHTFLGFSTWQWGLLSPSLFTLGLALRMWVL